jgi:hypothetical protein
MTVLKYLNVRLTTRNTVAAIGILVCAAPHGSVASAAAAPPPASQVGYTINSFSSNFTASTVDVQGTKNRGFKWYYWDLYSTRADPKSVVLNPDGSVTLHGDGTGAAGQLVTAVQYTATNSYVGATFSGGAYVEAELKFDPKAVAAASAVQAWPAFWALQLEGNILPNLSQWHGQAAGYLHSIELDFFEANHYAAGTLATAYGGAMHDWYGVLDKTCGHGLCQASMPYRTGMRLAPNGTDFDQFHRYGFLWVPATVSTMGYAEFYFDGEQVGPTQQWELFADQPPPPTNQRWAFGVLDRRHLFLILGTGQTQPMTVRSVNVWQRDTSANLVN